MYPASPHYHHYLQRMVEEMLAARGISVTYEDDPAVGREIWPGMRD
jgi:hypothetical protein